MLREKQLENFGRKLKISEENQKNQTNFKNFGRKPKILEGKQNKLLEEHQKIWKGNFDTSRRIIMLIRSLINSL